MTGQFKTALGYDLTKGVQFRRSLKLLRQGKPSAQLEGIYQDGKLVGLYSPFDVVFSSTPYEAYGCKGSSSGSWCWPSLPRLWARSSM